jgi:hypothetical protein
MDLSPGRARLAQAEDYEPGKNCYQPSEGTGRGTGTPVGQRKVLKCFNCDKPGHFKRDCRQPLRQNPFYRQNQGPCYATAVEAGGFSKCLNPTAWVRALCCNSVYITHYRSMRIPVSIRTSCFMADKRALVDSGATDNFMHLNFVTKMGLGMKELPNPRKIFNIDNTTNKSGKITHYLDLDVYTKGIHREMRFLITDIGSEDILLGYPWLALFEPKFSWRHAIIDERMLPVVISSVNPRIIRPRPVIAATLSKEGKRHIVCTLESQVTPQSAIRGVSTELAIQAGQNQVAAEIPKVYEQFAKLFSSEASSQFPPSRPWDHAIDFKPSAPDALPCKVYPMMQDEDKSLLKFLKEQEAKGYIRPSISPYASPFFFIQKKDGKLRPVQDY